MQATLLGDLIYVNIDRKPVPPFLADLRGFRRREFNVRSEFESHVQRSGQKSLIVVEVEQGSRSVIASYLQCLPEQSGSYFIFLCQDLDATVFQLQMHQRNFVALRRDEQVMVGELARLWQMGQPLFSRRAVRQNVRAPVMVKKSTYSQTSPTGSGITTLKEGELSDFSSTGARLTVKATSLKVKEFISLMYMSADGRWVCVEAQLRWIKEKKDGSQVLGVQFLAMSA